MSAPLSVSIVVQGRFHAFALAEALIKKGVPLRLYTNYPAFKAEQFGVPRKNLACFPLLGLLHRYSYRWGWVEKSPALERVLHRGFSRWARRGITRHETDVVHAFSGVALEIYRDLQRRKRPVLRMLMRGSAHISDQYKELHRESRLAAAHVELPSTWMMGRERQEYQVSHNIVTLSSYARNSFLNRGYAEDKILCLALGSDYTKFRPSRAVVDQRLARIRSGGPLKVLFTGNVSLQKGVRDMITVARALHGRMDFRLVGGVTQDAASQIAGAGELFDLVPRVPEAELPAIYNQADVFLFPTLHDGYAAVLAQAKAACVPVLCSSHCAGPDLITDDLTGWVLPARRPDLFIERLATYDQDREALARQVENLWLVEDKRDWDLVADDFLAAAERAHARMIRR
ncbi:MAG: glycosyltransferase family 4 protein [Verrucomicrobiota bacterium]